MPKKKDKPDTASGREVSIRMYNVGFGDAFLVVIPDGAAPRRILFDCGSIEAAAGMDMRSVVNRLIRDVTDPDGVARLDVVVATHRHKDHVSGFARPEWADVHVKEVWMPWTEHPTDPLARRIRDIQSRFALALHAAMAARGDSGGPLEKRYRDMIDNALMLSNDKAMKTLHSGFAGNPLRRFLPGEVNDKRTFGTDALPGAKVHVMGPSRTVEVIREMDPPKGESYLRMNAARDGSGLPPPPFAGDFRLDMYTGTGTLPPEDLALIQGAGSISELAAAVALDKAVNGTSLMIMLEVAGSHLLFPGDAQWGTWDAAMKDAEWKELLKVVAFYKVGHHGSHNATPKDFVEHMIPSGICAMASTLRRQIWPDIPRLPLIKALEVKNARFARSDQEAKAVKAFNVDQGVIEARIPL